MSFATLMGAASASVLGYLRVLPVLTLCLTLVEHLQPFAFDTARNILALLIRVIDEQPVAKHVVC